MPFIARYVFSFEDYLALMTAVHSRSKMARWALLIGSAPVLFLGITMTTAVDAFQEGKLPGSMAVLQKIGLFCAFLLALELVTRLPVVRRLWFKRCPLAGKQLTFELGDQRLSCHRDDIHDGNEWSAFKDVLASADAIVLLSGKYAGIVLPSRAFPSRRDFDAALRFVQAKVSAA